MTKFELMAQQIYFNNEDQFSKDFAKKLNQRVNQYFKEKGISKYGNWQMYVKTLAMFVMYFGPFVAVVWLQPSMPVAIVLCAIMGMGMAGIGLGVMHDAIHGSYSNKQWINKLMGYSLNVVGGNAINWRIQHNVKHHTYTNVDDHDEDIAPKAMLRLSPNSELKPAHKYQHVYAWFVYCLGSFFWVTFKDFIKFIAYYKEGSLQKNVKSVSVELAILLVTKIVYYSYIFGLPLLLTDFTFAQIFTGFLIMHLFCGLGLAVIFQPAHLMEEVEYPGPNANGQLQYSWTVHQLYTTINFANDNLLLNWYAGGLNFQIEHHLFPNICHVHYRNLAPIVRETAAEFNLPYHAKPGFFEALSAHTHQLKLLGSPAV